MDMIQQNLPFCRQIRQIYLVCTLLLPSCIIYFLGKNTITVLRCVLGNAIRMMSKKQLKIWPQILTGPGTQCWKNLSLCYESVSAVSVLYNTIHFAGQQNVVTQFTHNTIINSGWKRKRNMSSSNSFTKVLHSCKSSRARKHGHKFQQFILLLDTESPEHYQHESHILYLPWQQTVITVATPYIATKYTSYAFFSQQSCAFLHICCTPNSSATVQCFNRLYITKECHI